MDNHAISIIVPIYNEEEILVNAIRTNLSVIEHFTNNFELIVVNDGSRDKSKQLIDANFANRPNIHIQHQPQNGGFGSAVRKGIELSTKQHIICVPADSPMDDSTFKSFYENIGKGQVLVGYRLKRKGYTARMHLNSIGFHFLISTLFGMRLKDYNWIHMYDRSLFDEGNIVIEYNGLFMLAEVLIKAKRKGYQFCEFPVEQRQRLTGIATASKLSAVLKTIRDIFGFYFKGK